MTKNAKVFDGAFRCRWRQYAIMRMVEEYPRAMDVEEVDEWLVDGAPGCTTAPEVVTRLADELVKRGAPIDRMAAFVQTLHPSVAGRAFAWRPDRGTEVFELDHERYRGERFAKSPIAVVARTGEELLRTIDPAAVRVFGTA